ncbi:MAG: hypothetical protein GY858_08585 [Candidatus Omnitrophica bacterium]|nr:hypothetical protein [Candidatus Omnitrophota bacterium]
MKNKILITTLFLLFSISSSAFSEQINPEKFIIDLIKAAQDNNLKEIEAYADLKMIASHPRHSMEPKEFIEFLKGIDLERIEFQKLVNRGIEKGRILVRILKPISCDFELEVQPDSTTEIGTKIRVVDVHP